MSTLHIETIEQFIARGGRITQCPLKDVRPKAKHTPQGTRDLPTFVEEIAYESTSMVITQAQAFNALAAAYVTKDDVWRYDLRQFIRNNQ